MPPILATLGHPPTGERWALWSRNGNQVSDLFPEIVALDKGVPSFAKRKAQSAVFADHPPRAGASSGEIASVMRSVFCVLQFDVRW
ncbi:hypothetical protein C8E04_6323 [Rhodococcus globerulus]|nr:hypothetical protein C8E04_6323 [Rhodococcus globerulus]